MKSDGLYPNQGGRETVTGFCNAVEIELARLKERTTDNATVFMELLTRNESCLTVPIGVTLLVREKDLRMEEKG
jgi:hypothetical protein